MARNIEVKARVEHLASLTTAVAALADQGPRELAQDDTFFHCPNGRLKLRTCPIGGAELIFYRREDRSGPKESFYVRAPVADPDGLRETLTLAYGQLGRVRKQRILFLAGRTRIHLDRVEGLGDFVELEVVLRENEPSAAGVQQAHALLGRLDIATSRLIEGAYVDLLTRTQNPR